MRRQRTLGFTVRMGGYMKQRLLVMSMAALAAFALAVGVQADCGKCEPGDAVKAACTAGCKKPCCAAQDAAGAKCKSGECAAKSADAKCMKGACDKTQAKAQCTKGACGSKGAEAQACKMESSKASCASSEEHAKAEVAEINTAGLKALLDAGATVTVLDARSGKYDDGRRIPGAAALAADASEEDAAKAIGSKDALVVTYCANLKCPASAMLAHRLKELGYKNVIEYPYGIDGWDAAGNAVEKAKR